jgi:hypothetical protein
MARKVSTSTKSGESPFFGKYLIHLPLRQAQGRACTEDGNSTGTVSHLNGIGCWDVDK